MMTKGSTGKTDNR